MDKLIKGVQKSAAEWVKNDVFPLVFKELQEWMEENKFVPDGGHDGFEAFQGKVESKFDEFCKEAKKKKTPKKNSPAVDDGNCFLTVDKAIKYMEENPEENRCQWRIPRGENKDRICFKLIDGECSEEAKSRYELRCKNCKRNNSEKSNQRNAEFFENYELRNGAQGGVKASPLADEADVSGKKTETAELAGVAGVTSPVPDPAEKFLEGKNTTEHSPSRAKKGKRTPSSIGAAKIKEYGDGEDYTDYTSTKKHQDKFYLLLRRDKATKEFTCGGKFKSSFEPKKVDNLYLQDVVELNEEEIEEIKKSNLTYKYFGQSKFNEDEAESDGEAIEGIPVIESDKEEEDEEDLDSLMASLE